MPSAMVWVKAIIGDLLIPAPEYEEQKTIAKQLNNTHKLITSRREQLIKLDELIKARFVEIFGDPVTNPKGWERKPLISEDCAIAFIGLTYKPSNVTKDGTVVLRSSNIQNSKLAFDDVVRVNAKIKDKLWVKDGDILMCTRNGSARLVGKVALIENLSEPMTLGAFMTIIRSPYYRYLLTYFQTEDFRRQIVCGKTTTVNQITINMLENILVPLPSKPLQDDFAKFVQKVEVTKAKLQQSLEKLETCYKALMQEYFS